MQTIAAEPNRLRVLREEFEALEPGEQQLLCERGVVEKKSTTIDGGRSRLTITPKRKPAAPAARSDQDLSTQLAACQQKEKVARRLLDESKERIHARWPAETKVIVTGEGTVTLGKKPASSMRTSYACRDGEAAFRASLSDEEQRRFKHVFARPDAILLVRDQTGGRMRSSNKSGRALTVSTGGASASGAARLPTTSFASRA